ncbi:hypothetical protein N0V90_000669 [Kalmusia sp. IMI 367209]|nr:hypothetical protein N0V90_000669 [Kalmusia sp. IMI 367209]
MPLGQFVNQTLSKCTPPLLDKATFSKIGGCIYEELTSGTEWRQELRVPNYLSILSVTLCLFILISFAALPPDTTHRHYLSVGLLISVLFISLSFAIPVSANPSMCYDAITPHDMKSSVSCAWTGSLVTVGGLGSVVWVFLRSLWLHIRIFWDRDPGNRFKWFSIIVGTVLPLVFLISILAVTGFSYRMGQTCLPNQKHAIVTFWIWLVVFAILAFLLQTITTGYCFYVYVRTLRREQRASTIDSFQRGQASQKMETWSHVKRLFLLHWRNILISVFVIIGSISFFVVFWTQGSKLGRVFNDPENIKPVKTWIICLTLSSGNKESCRKYVKNFTVNQGAVLTSLILASLVGISIFILLFRFSFIHAWIALLRRLYHHGLHSGRPPTPQLTSLENPDEYQNAHLKRSPTRKIFSIFSTTNASPGPSFEQSIGTAISADTADYGTELKRIENRPTFERVTSETGLITPPGVSPFPAPLLTNPALVSTRFIHTLTRSSLTAAAPVRLIT